ncbi:MAG: hypothetical protein AB7F35_07860 [Acetobacteraceae bacterium]
MADQPEPLSDLIIPPPIATRLAEVANAQHRHPLDVLSDAVNLYLRDQQTSAVTPRSRAEAAARIRQSRAGNKLPEGVTIRDLMTYKRP